MFCNLCFVKISQKGTILAVQTQGPHFRAPWGLGYPAQTKTLTFLIVTQSHLYYKDEAPFKAFKLVQPVQDVAGFVLLLDGVLDSERREADPGRVDADLRRRERRVRRPSTCRSENFLAAALFLTKSACDWMGPACSNKVFQSTSESAARNIK